MEASGNLLDLFAWASGYKINSSKSTLIGLNKTLEIKAEVAIVTVAPWSSWVKYLGIKLTDIMDPTSLLDLNLIGY